MTGHTEPPRLDYPIPPDAPDEVAQAHENFTRMCAEYGELKAQLAEAPAAREREIGMARAAAATARVERTKPPARTQDKVAREWDARIAKLEEETAETAEAVRQAYEALMRSIVARKDEWMATFIELDKVETTKLVEEIHAVEDRLERLSDIRSAPFWLASFFPGQTPYPGGRMRASFGNLWQIANPPMNLAHWRRSIPIYERIYHGERHLCYADGSPVEDEIVAELRDVTHAGRS